MRHYSAQYIFTNTGTPLKRSIISTEDDGTITAVENTDGNLNERHSVEFHNGIIIPGFINCHCHLELSWMKDKIPEGTGLSRFLTEVNTVRNRIPEDIESHIMNADSGMTREGIVACADICNSDVSFHTKKKSRIKYTSFLEVFGIDPLKAEKRINEISGLIEEADREKLRWYLTPHSLYSVSTTLFRMIRILADSNEVSSVHFLESEAEKELLTYKSGPLMEAYRNYISPESHLEINESPVKSVLENITTSGNLLLVHNTFIEKSHIENLRQRGNIYYCLCPNSNNYIEKKLPPVNLLTAENCEIVIGTDSLCSNKKLSIIDELRTIQQNFPEISLEMIIRWATFNGAKALGEIGWAGSIEPGKKPGLVVIENLDLVNMKLLPSSRAKRII